MVYMGVDITNLKVPIASLSDSLLIHTEKSRMSRTCPADAPHMSRIL
jgi:hypothetical protein